MPDFHNKSPTIRINEVYRDAIQSLMGTRPSAKEIVNAHNNAHNIGTATIQTAGGTFFDIPAKQGRDEWDFNEKILSHFGSQGMFQTALIRNDCLFGYRPQPFDVIKATVEEFAKMGVNRFQNFHGLNYTPAMEGVAEAVRQVQVETGLNVEAWGTICIEDNANVTVENCLRTAEELLKNHSGLYFKSASGVTSPDFNHALFMRLGQEFGDVPKDIHAHGTYGLAAASYMAAIQASVEQGHSIGIDCQHPALAGSTAHPNMLKMTSLMRHSPSKAVRAAAPELNTDAIEADMMALLRMRYTYRSTEARYNRELMESMREARAPGGASATLMAIPGLVETLAGKLGTKNWDAIQIAIYEKQAEILKDLGDPTQVTPYALTTTNEAAFQTAGLKGMHPDTAFYLAGGLGAVPESANPEWVERAKGTYIQNGQDLPGKYMPSLQRDTAMPGAEQALKDAGLASPTQRQTITAATMKGGVDHVLAVAGGTNKPAKAPTLPDYALSVDAPLPLQESWLSKDKPIGLGQGQKSQRLRGFVQELGGIENIFLMAERALHIRKLDDGWEVFPKGQEYQEEKWVEDNIRELKAFLEEDAPLAMECSVIGRMNAVHRKQCLNVLQEVFDDRSEGLFDFTQDMIRERSMGLDHSPAPDQA